MYKFIKYNTHLACFHTHLEPVINNKANSKRWTLVCNKGLFRGSMAVAAAQSLWINQSEWRIKLWRACKPISRTSETTATLPLQLVYNHVRFSVAGVMKYGEANRLRTTLILKEVVISGKKFFNIVFSTYFLKLIGVLVLIFVYLVIEKLKRLIWYLENFHVVLITFFSELCCRWSVNDKYSDNTDDN